MNDMVNRFEAERFKTLNANGHLIRYDEFGAGWRYATLLEKEPETIEWIDSFAPGDTLWDIGANVGIYSVYAGVKGIRTHSFEPHFANYHQLCASIALNNLQDHVTPLCLAFAERKSISEMNLASVDVGSSMSNFGEALDFRGRPFEPAFRQGMIGYDIDSFIADFGLDVPTHLKIDVDGIELPIVKGAQKMLANEQLQSVSIELVETDAAQVAGVMEIMARAGLHFVHKKQNMAFATTDTTDVKNFLFHRNPEKLGLRDDSATDTRALTVGDDGADVTIDDLVARIAAKISAAPLDREPCGNLYMEDLFPAGVYNELLARLPSDSALDPIVHPDAVTTDRRTTRYLLDLTPDSLERFPAEDRAFWEAMMQVFTAPEIVHALALQFGPWLRERFGHALPELVAVPVFYRDFPGYRIGIHPDAPYKIATMQFYLPADETQRYLGTVFHKRVGSTFERHKKNEFRPNSAYSFVRTEESWHSVDELGEDESPRNTIALTFYIKGQEYRSRQRNAAKTQPGMTTTSGAYDDEVAQAMGLLASTFTRRDDVATLFMQGGTGVELGVAAGALSEGILLRSQCKHLYSIDSWAGAQGHDVNEYREAVVRLSPHRERNSILRMRFDEALPLFDDHSLDFIYLDGGPEEPELAGRTLEDWFAKIKAGGIIAGGDYHSDWPMLVATVNRFAADNGLELHVVNSSETGVYPVWFAMKP